MVSKNILSVKAFDASGDMREKDGFYSYALYYGSNNWEESTLRRWLNATKEKIDWNKNTPGKKNVFNGENAYDEESGFLSSNHFKSEELEAIEETSYDLKNGKTIQDKVFILTSEEYLALLKNDHYYPLQIPTTDSISGSDYQGYDLSHGKAFSIWTRDPADNPYSVHAVKTISGDGEEQIGVACAGRYGIMPAMTLDKEIMSKHLVRGDGTYGNPYQFSFKQGFSMNPWILIIAIILGIGILFIWLIKKHQPKTIKIVLFAMLLIASVATMAYCSSNSSSAKLLHQNEDDYLVIQKYSQDMDLIIKRLDKMSENESLIIVDNQGNDITSEVIHKYDSAKTLAEKETWIKELGKSGYHVLYKGDFRITNFKKEIEGVFDGDHYIVKTQEAEIGYQMVKSAQLTEDFKRAVNDDYLKHNYTAIKAYLDQNNLIIRHPSDTSNTGIPSLYAN